ncbi:hypothetical protein B7494_g4451 [Chlorociboria aeruginascens]|nr:hypothetical protein B7494_g4451 [Chlorociboria aeruginascens]
MLKSMVKEGNPKSGIPLTARERKLASGRPGRELVSSVPKRKRIAISTIQNAHGVPLQSTQNGCDASFSLPPLDSDPWEHYGDLVVSDSLPSRNSTNIPEIAPPYPLNDQSKEVITIAGPAQQQTASLESIAADCFALYRPDNFPSVDISFTASLGPASTPAVSGIGLPVSFSTSLVPFSPDSSNWGVLSPLDFDQIIPNAPKSFRPRHSHNNLLALNRSFVICTLRSYAYMIVPNKSLPPFIHPLCLVDVSGDYLMQQASLPKPLALCAAISVKYNDVDAVAALQAVTIYFLLRLSEDDTDATNFDVPLIYTMIQLAQQTEGIIDKYNLLFDISIGFLPHACDGSKLAGIALPCARGLWSAGTKSEWEKEYDAQPRRPGVEKQLTYGDLLNLRFKENGALDSWLSHLDEFGMLVMAAASIPDERNNQ